MSRPAANPTRVSRLIAGLKRHRWTCLAAAIYLLASTSIGLQPGTLARAAGPAQPTPFLVGYGWGWRTFPGAFATPCPLRFEDPGKTRPTPTATPCVGSLGDPRSRGAHADTTCPPTPTPPPYVTQPAIPPSAPRAEDPIRPECRRAPFQGDPECRITDDVPAVGPECACGCIGINRLVACDPRGKCLAPVGCRRPRAIVLGSTMAFQLMYLDLARGGAHTIHLRQLRLGGHSNWAGLTTDDAMQQPAQSKRIFKGFFYLEGVDTGKKTGIVYTRDFYVDVDPVTHQPETDGYHQFQFGLHPWYHSACLVQNQCTTPSSDAGSPGSDAPLSAYERVFWTGWYRHGLAVKDAEGVGTNALDWGLRAPSEAVEAFQPIAELDGGVYSFAAVPDNKLHVHTFFHRRYFVTTPRSESNKLKLCCRYLCPWCSCTLLNMDGSSPMRDWNVEYTGEPAHVVPWDTELPPKEERARVFAIDGNQWDVCMGEGVPGTPCNACHCPPPALDPVNVRNEPVPGLPLTWNFIRPLPDGSDDAEWTSMARLAAERWNDLTRGTIGPVLVYDPDATSPDVTVELVPHAFWKNLGEDHDVASAEVGGWPKAYSDCPAGIYHQPLAVRKVQVHLFPEQRILVPGCHLSTAGLMRAPMELVLVHEFGHILGLGHSGTMERSAEHVDTPEEEPVMAELLGGTGYNGCAVPGLFDASGTSFLETLLCLHRNP